MTFMGGGAGGGGGRRGAPDLARAADAIAARGGRLGLPLVIEEETGSTNDDAKQGAREGAAHGAVWLAESQRSGRGRQGRVWVSPRGENLLFSVLLRLSCPPPRVPPVSLACGLAVRDAVARAVGDDAAVLVKWPNDVVVKQPNGSLRKVAGILVESSVAGSRVESVVVGVGINVHTRAFPDELLSVATSIGLERDARADAETGSRLAPLDRAEVLADVLAGLDRDVEHVAHRGLGLVLARLSRSDALLGREVEGDDGAVRGVAAGIDTEGRLLVCAADGAITKVVSGEVRVRLA